MRAIVSYQLNSVGNNLLRSSNTSIVLLEKSRSKSSTSDLSLNCLMIDRHKIRPC